VDAAALEYLGFEIALGTYLISSVVFILHFSTRKRRFAEMGFSLIAFGFIFQTIALALRWFYAGHPPWVNSYEVMSFFAWATVAAYLTLNIRSDYKSVGVLVGPLAFVVLSFASLQPANPTPLVPALQSVWLLIHVPITILSYCAFFMAFAASVLYLFKSKQLSEQRPTNEPYRQSGSSEYAAGRIPPEATGFLAKFTLNQLDDLAYKSVAVGFPLLTIGILTGAIWAETAWGNYWSWDPKETWSLITWFVFLAYLHVRTQYQSHSLAAYIAAFGFVSVMFTFLGVGYVLPLLQTYIGVSTGLHGYAGGNAIAGSVLFFGILGAVLFLLFKTRKKPPSVSHAPAIEDSLETTSAH
jgi:cytochrome c-type biogenesis protein CcsB